MTTFLIRLFSFFSPRLVAIFIAGISAASLAAAFISQFGFDLKPCDLCLIQRIPFAINIGLGLIGLACLGWTRILIGVSGVSFLINSVIAFYHSGVERHWWSGLSGCSTPDMSGSIEDLMARIQSTDVTRCDEIPWDLFGLSMANYNVMMCLGLGVACFLYLFLNKAERIMP